MSDTNEVSECPVRTCDDTLLGFTEEDLAKHMANEHPLQYQLVLYQQLLQLQQQVQSNAIGQMGI